MSFTIAKLTEYFQKLPGIGPRQASRFVYYLLTEDEDFLSRLACHILNLKKNVRRCASCQRFFSAQGETSPFQGGEMPKECEICRIISRDKSLLLVTEKDVDLDNIEKAGFYNGFYFVLGGLVPILGKNLPKEIKMKELFERAKKEAAAGDLKEIILALNATIEGDNTCRYIEKILEPILKKRTIKISRLGRGLSTGTELEYSDRETIISALKSRQ